MKKTFPLFEIVEIKNIPYLYLQFDKHNEEHLAWLSQNLWYFGSDYPTDWPTDLCIRIPLIPFVETYTALDQCKHLLREELFGQAVCKGVVYPSRVIIDKPDFDSSEIRFVFVNWHSGREWTWCVDLNLAMLGLDEFVDNVGSLNALKHGLAKKSFKQTQKMYPIFHCFY